MNLIRIQFSMPLSFHNKLIVNSKQVFDQILKEKHRRLIEHSMTTNKTLKSSRSMEGDIIFNINSLPYCSVRNAIK